MDQSKQQTKKTTEGQGKKAMEAQPPVRPTTSKASQGQTKPKAKDREAEKASSVRVSSLEEVDLMTDMEVQRARISGASRKRMKVLLGEGKSYLEAKRAVIKENFLKAGQSRENKGKGKPTTTTSGSEATKTKPLSKKSKGKAVVKMDNTEAQKRSRSEGSTPQADSRKKRVKLDAASFKEALTAVKIAIIQEGYPKGQLDEDRLKAVKASVLAAYDVIPREGPQVRLAKCVLRPGHLVMTCADSASAAWLRDVVPTLRPWEGASLVALEGDDIPKPCACTVFVPDEDGVRVEAERLLSRLKVSNHGLNTEYWKVWASTPMDKGRMWVLQMDKESLEELKKLDMSPYFGIGKLKFRQKNVGHTPEKADPSHSGVKTHTGANIAQDEADAKTGRGGSPDAPLSEVAASLDTGSLTGTSPTKRAQVPMEVETAPGEGDSD